MKPQDQQEHGKWEVKPYPKSDNYYITDGIVELEIQKGIIHAYRIAKDLNDLSRLRTENEELRRGREWIPVSERLPGEWEKVFVFITAHEAQFVDIGTCNGKELVPSSKETYIWEPSHWMPFKYPEPPSAPQANKSGKESEV